ncbi:MAG TPA: hypothetical protein H9857_09095 [Candidatus Desulfovibrio intestinigallinarum]|nr:hypothetical protein [Candidatus Desulfovibrio intestinigallinarum]
MSKKEGESPACLSFPISLPDILPFPAARLHLCRWPSAHPLPDKGRALRRISAVTTFRQGHTR